MAMEPSLWGTLPRDILPLVFAHLPVAGIGRLRVLSKEWKRNVDSKDSEFNKFIDATTDLRKFVLLSWDSYYEGTLQLFNLEAENWRVFEADADFPSGYAPIAADGGLFCGMWEPVFTEPRQSRLIVVNPLTQMIVVLPPLLRESDVCLRAVQLTMNRETRDYKLHVFSELKLGGLHAQVYDSHSHSWSESSEYSGLKDSIDRDFGALGYEVREITKDFVSSSFSFTRTWEEDCLALKNDSVFKLHEKSPVDNSNLEHDGAQNSIFCHISEYHFSESVNDWVEFREHDCDPSISHPRELAVGEAPDKLSLLACNGFLLVHNRESHSVWLYNFSTSTWSNLPDLDLDLRYFELMMCEVNWSAIP